MFVVATNRCAGGMHLLLSVSTLRPNKHYDATCLFKGGEHSFISSPSYVVYGKPHQLSASHIIKMVDGGHYPARETLEEPHFGRLCAGIANSPFSKPFAIKYYADNRPA